MLLDDRSADGQPHAHTRRLRRLEWIKHFGSDISVDAGTVVRYGDFDAVHAAGLDGYLDFGIFFVIILLWSLGSGLAVIKLNALITGDTSNPDTDIIVGAGLIMQLGMLYIFLKFRFYHRSPNEGALSPRIISIGQSFIQGLENLSF